MNTALTSHELLQKHLESWTAFAGRGLSENAQEAWLKQFVNTDSSVLKDALELVTSRAKRMPWPGDLTEALSIVRERRDFADHEPIKDYAMVDSQDPETGRKVRAQIDEHGDLYFKAADCPEGRQFLKLAKQLMRNAPK